MNPENVDLASPLPSLRAREMPRYVRSNFSIGPGVEMLQLSRNESAISLQPAWLEAAARAVETSVSYPDPECTVLRQAIAETFALDAHRIVCSAGLMECLQTIALTYLDPGDNVVVPEHAFAFFRHVTHLAGANIQLARERNLQIDIEEILKTAGQSAKLVIFANPGNPTGSYLCKQCIVELRLRLPPATLLVIDEAYAEFVQEDRYQSLFDLTDSGNVIILRSFSKMYGLAGFRVAWAYCPPGAVDYMQRIQIPAIVGSVAQAIASAAVRDQRSVQSFKQEMIAVRRRFIDRLKHLDRINPVESETNFVLLRTQSHAEAQSLDGFLRYRGIVLRRQTPVGLGECLRATIGNEMQMQFVAVAIIDWCNELPVA